MLTIFLHRLPKNFGKQVYFERKNRYMYICELENAKPKKTDCLGTTVFFVWTHEVHEAMETINPNVYLLPRIKLA